MPPAADILRVSRRVRVPLSEFTFHYVRSSGPGGQNVNKVNTKAQLRWQVAESPGLPEDVRERFMQRFRRRISNEGELIVSSQRYRDQSRNAADCLEKLQAMLAEVATRPKARKKTKPTRGSRERRIKDKKQHSQKKQRRRDSRLD